MKDCKRGKTIIEMSLNESSRRQKTTREIVIHDMLYIPDHQENLISWLDLCFKGLDVKSKEDNRLLMIDRVNHFQFRMKIGFL